MIVEDVVKVDGCLEGTNVYDVRLVGKIDKELIIYLGKIGKLVYKDNYERPFFRVIVRGKYTLKGVMEDDEIRVILPDESTSNEINEIINLIKLF